MYRGSVENGRNLGEMSHFIRPFAVSYIALSINIWINLSPLSIGLLKILEIAIHQFGIFLADAPLPKQKTS